MAKKILIIGYVWPEPKSTAAGSRMLQLICFFKSQNYQILFASPCAKSNQAFNLETIGVTQYTIQLNNSSFDVFVKELNPQIVMFDRFMMEEQFGWRVAQQCPKAIRILDTEDLHCLRKGRQQAFKDGKPFENYYVFNDTAKREIASIYRCDLSLIISETEIELLKNTFSVPEYLLVYVPFMLETILDEVTFTLPKFNERQHFISLGNFLHEPNYNAVLYLKETLWELIKTSLPNAELHIYGAYASPKVNQLHNEKDGFLVKGFTNNVYKVMQNAKVCLAPLRFGAGLKGKLVDAMQSGTPCVMSTLAAEGMFGNLKSNGFIADDPQAFAKKAIQLYNDKPLWKEKQQNGFKIINQRFNKTVNEQLLIATIKNTTKQLINIRQNNFTGQMLMHHTLQSTKFMSKWIEEKNSKN